MELTATYTPVAQNGLDLNQELNWLSQVIQTRLALYFGQDSPYSSIDELLPPNLSGSEGHYAQFVRMHRLSPAERLLLILAMVPHVRPELLDIFLTKNGDYDRRYSEFGGILQEGHTGLIPTAETALFILAADDLPKRISYQPLFRADHFFSRHQVIQGATPKKGMPRFSGTWLVADEYVDVLLTGQPFHPAYSEDFPAHLITTQMEWDEIVLNRKTAEKLQEIREWVRHGQVVMDELGLGRMLKPGYKSLFYGPPGTGKSMTAALLGKSTGQPVYRIDLSMVVSKYIGETEKNLARVFDQAEKHQWILFFDEADSLFGTRTQVNSANDRYGNQEIGYLLQRMEDFPGVIILASNLKDNIDEAFTRRFQAMVEFRMPDAGERHQLWKQSYSPKLPLDPTIDLWHIAEQYALSGGLIMNVVRKATLRAVTLQAPFISQKELEGCIRQELHKEGILLN